MKPNHPTSFGNLKKKNIDVSLEWIMLDKAKSHSPSTRTCMLCILYLGLKLLNKRNKLL